MLLLLDRLEDFRKGLFFGVTEILLLVLGIYGDEVHSVRSGEIVRTYFRLRNSPKFGGRPVSEFRSLSPNLTVTESDL